MDLPHAELLQLTEFNVELTSTAGQSILGLRVQHVMHATTGHNSRS